MTVFFRINICALDSAAQALTPFHFLSVWGATVFAEAWALPVQTRIVSLLSKRQKHENEGSRIDQRSREALRIGQEAKTLLIFPDVR